MKLQIMLVFLPYLLPKEFTEYNLLQLLIKHPKQTFTKESLYQLIWGKDYISDDNTLNVHISKLRKKLEHIGNQAPYIDTVWGIGYKLHR